MSIKTFAAKHVTEQPVQMNHLSKNQVTQAKSFEDNREATKQHLQLQKLASSSLSTNKAVIQQAAKKAKRPLAQAEYDTSSSNHGINGRGVLHHAHIIFDRGYALPVVGASDNVGYHAEKGASGPGELFKEQVHTRGYNNFGQISSNSYEDRILIQSIARLSNFGEYKLGRHDCQSWVKAVEKDFASHKDEGAEMQTSEEINQDKEAKKNVELANRHALSPNGIELDDL